MATPRKDPGRGGWRVDIAVTVGGEKRRRCVRGRTRAETIERADQAKIEMKAGTLPLGGTVTVSEWLENWIAARESAGNVRPKTLTDYRTNQKWVDKFIGNIKLADLIAEDVERMYRDIQRAGRGVPTVLHVRRTLRTALNAAVARGRIPRNVVTLAEAPRQEEKEVEPLDMPELRDLLSASEGLRNGARWAVAALAGLRQGEALGLQWDDIDIDSGAISVQRALARTPWRHGCSGRTACKDTLPNHCPRRFGGGLTAAPLKTRAAKRTVPMPDELVALMREHRRRQTEERLQAGEMWQHGPGGGWVFATEIGTPIDPRNDQRHWKRALAAAGITRRVRIHDLRHTAATLNLLAGNNARVVQGLFGWTSPELLTRYAHPVEEAKRQAVARVGSIVWPGGESGAL